MLANYYEILCQRVSLQQELMARGRTAVMKDTNMSAAPTEGQEKKMESSLSLSVGPCHKQN